MSTVEIVLVVATALVAGGSAGVGLFQLAHLEGQRVRGIGNIVVGLGFALISRDLMTPPGLSLATALGALVALAGGVLIPLKRPGSRGPDD